MNDRELFMMAAKAAGISKEMLESQARDLAFAGRSEDCWSPLTDDGDALRLAVKLSLDFYVDEKQAGCWINDFVCLVEDISTDLYAATRRAIVRAAAEIGRML